MKANKNNHDYEKLSIKEKAKRYDEAIEMARKINDGEGVPAPPNWTTYEVIFPELKESEDEKIRKAILLCIRFVERLFGCEDIEGIAIADLKSWLEKKQF